MINKKIKLEKEIGNRKGKIRFFNYLSSPILPPSSIFCHFESESVGSLINESDSEREKEKEEATNIINNSLHGSGNNVDSYIYNSSDINCYNDSNNDSSNNSSKNNDNNNNNNNKY